LTVASGNPYYGVEAQAARGANSSEDTMRVLFVTNAGRYNYTEPLGPMYLSAVLRDVGHETRFVPDTAKAAGDVIAAWQPGVVAYMATTGEHVRLIALNRELRQKAEFLSIFGGPHPTFFPQMVEEEGVDAICRGEGEGAILDLVEALEKGDDVRSIRNLWVKDVGHGAIRKNDVRPLIEDLDALPFPDRATFYRLYNRAEVYGVPHFMVGRGCPFNCTYCFNKPYFDLYAGKGSRVRLRSPENVVSEIEQFLESYRADRCIFHDDVFPTRAEWLEPFRTAYRERVHRPFTCYLRVELVDGDTCRLLREAGCDTVFIGIESGNESFRRDVMHRRMTNGQIRAACRAFHDAGIRFCTNNIVGAPGETLETAMDTLRLNLECRPALASGFFFQPYPGTEAGELAMRLGLFDGDLSVFEADLGAVAGSYKIPNATQLNRFRSLLALAVGVPVLAGIVPLLVRLPLGAVYRFLYRLWAGYCYKFRLFPAKMGPWNFLKGFFRYFRSKGPY